MVKKLGIKSGDEVMTVDQAEAYSVPLISLMTSLLEKAGVKVDRESQPATQTDFTSLAQKAVAENAKVVVVLAGQVASNAQLFLQQLQADGFTGKFISTDGTFDSTKFTVPGAYISSFSLDIHYDQGRRWPSWRRSRAGSARTRTRSASRRGSPCR